jgi:hypothetical protein
MEDVKFGKSACGGGLRMKAKANRQILLKAARPRRPQEPLSITDRTKRQDQLAGTHEKYAPTIQDRLTAMQPGFGPLSDSCFAATGNHHGHPQPGDPPSRAHRPD